MASDTAAVEAPPASSGGDQSSKAASGEAPSGPGESTKHQQRSNKSRRSAGGWGKKDHKRKWSKHPDRREQVAAEANKRQKNNRKASSNAEGDAGEQEQQTPPVRGIVFSAEEIAAEERRPKRKVAVMIGYAGTGYHGLQINHVDKTIEGDLFAAFVAAGAISKANAIDPKKSSLVRCARTDKGVHAAANLLSLKLIIEDDGIKDKINSHLPEQIRVWGIQRANNAFSAYQACDSRCYEYLLPSYALLPPHPSSFLGKQLVTAAKETGTYEAMRERMGDTQTIWEDIEESIVKPILSALPAEEREAALKELRRSQEEDVRLESIGENPPDATSNLPGSDVAGAGAGAVDNELAVEMDTEPTATTCNKSAASVPVEDGPAAESADKSDPVQEAIRKIKGAYLATKKGYRISPSRIEWFQEALNKYVGTHNFHNFTVRKSFKETSSKRYIKSFVVNPKPILIGETEWLSLKVWGQSFMMHQIRKMVAMAVMVVRCGSELSTIEKSYREKRIGIPKAPSLGLLLERPLFDSYNIQAEGRYGKPPIDFDTYEKEIHEFKDRQIYARMWEEEERKNTFHLFFHQLDAFQTEYFAWATAHGIEKAKERHGTGTGAVEEVLGSDDENAEDGEG